MTKKLMLFLLVLFCTATFASDLPRIAVHVTGHDDINVLRVLYTDMLDGLTRDRRYVAIERSAEFFSKAHEQGDNVMALSRQYNADFLCGVSIKQALDEYYISTQIYSFNTNSVVASANSTSPLRTMDDILTASANLTGGLLGSRSARVARGGRESGDNARLGRVAEHEQAGQQSATESEYRETKTVHATTSIGYSGLGLNVYHHWERNWSSGNAYFNFGHGVGLVYKGLLGYSLDFRGGVNMDADFDLIYGDNIRFSFLGIENIIYVGSIYRQWLLTMGYFAASSHDVISGFAFNLGYVYSYQSQKWDWRREKKAKDPDRPRYFRLGLELNYPAWRDSVDFFENSFPYPAIGGGLFFRLGTDKIYLSTGFYAKAEMLERHETRDLGLFGITLTTLPLMDIYWSRFFWEIPVLLNFGSGQIRFTGGLLLDFYAASDFQIDVLGNTVLSESNRDRIMERFSESPDGNMYWVAGLDFDILKHWGIGVKFLILNNTFGDYESYDGFKSNAMQVRVSTYLVF